MNSAYEEFASGSQSPYNVGRGAHPGAVLLSPQSSAMNLSNSVASAVVLSPQLKSQPHNMFLNELLDQQSLLLDAQQQFQAQHPVQQTSTHSAAGSAVMSPLVQSPTRTPANISSSSMFLDSFTKQSSNTLLGMHTRSHSANKPQSQPQNQQQQQTDPNPVVNFTQDINQLCSWMSMLSSAQQNTVMDNLLSTLNEDVLQYTKLKLDSLMNSGYLSPQIPAIASPVPNRENYPITNLDSVLFSEKNKGNDEDSNHIDSRIDNSMIYQQWSPQPTSMTQPIYDYIKDMHQRPKSADPHVSRANGNQKTKRSQANLNFNVHNHSNHSYSNHNNYYSSKGRQGNIEFENGNTSNSTSGHPYYGSRQPNIPNNTLSPEISPNSSSNVNVGVTTSSPVSAAGGSINGSGSSMNPRTLTDPRLLTNIPSWLKSLRLHKYSEALGAKKWDELIYLDDDSLEKMGISALGARRKLLKAFAIVRDYKEHGLIDQTAYT